MPRYLLDTHTLIWAIYQPEKLSEKVQIILQDKAAEIYVSAVTAYEIAQKYRLGKLSIARSYAEDFAGELIKDGFLPINLTHDHAQYAGIIRFDHRDPFDRMLIAQAQIEQMILISNEKLFDQFGVIRLW
jgi:PIN domain nuclease of toxin-antitoxin system